MGVPSSSPLSWVPWLPGLFLSRLEEGGHGALQEEEQACLLPLAYSPCTSVSIRAPLRHPQENGGSRNTPYTHTC